MTGSDDMANAYRAKSTGIRRSGPVAPKPVGAAMTTAPVGILASIPSGSTPAPVGAPQAIGDGTGHMGSWADKEHPLPQP